MLASKPVPKVSGYARFFVVDSLASFSKLLNCFFTGSRLALPLSRKGG